MDNNEDKNKDPLLESSHENDDEWLSKWKRSDIIPKQSFSDDTKLLTAYLENSRLLADAFTSIIISNRTFRVDKSPPSIESRMIVSSSWRELGKSLKNLKTFKSQDNEISRLAEISMNMANAEENMYRLTKDKKKFHSQIYDAATDYRKKMSEQDGLIIKSLARCNKRRRRVEHAQILFDLRDQGKRYTAAIEKLDSECFEMFKFHAMLFNYIPQHYKHCKEIMAIFCQTTKLRKEVFKGEKVEKEGPSEKADIPEKTSKENVKE